MACCWAHLVCVVPLHPMVRCSVATRPQWYTWSCFSEDMEVSDAGVIALPLGLCCKYPLVWGACHKLHMASFPTAGHTTGSLPGHVFQVTKLIQCNRTSLQSFSCVGVPLRAPMSVGVWGDSIPSCWICCCQNLMSISHCASLYWEVQDAIIHLSLGTGCPGMPVTTKPLKSYLGGTSLSCHRACLPSSRAHGSEKVPNVLATSCSSSPVTMMS